MRDYLKFVFTISLISASFTSCLKNPNGNENVINNCLEEKLVLEDSLQKIKKMNDSLQVVLFFTEKKIGE